jgi:hypothetical protein
MDIITTMSREERNAELRERIMDLRDQRYSIYKLISALEDKQAFHPDRFSADDQYWLRYHKSDVARIKAEEARLRSLIH